MPKRLFFLLLVLAFSCKSKVEKTKPAYSPISESIYASGIVKSENQYQAFATVNGIINAVFVTEGDSVKKGDPILAISNEAQKLGKENAALAASFADFKNNQDKLNDALSQIDLALSKMKNDSALFFRQKNLWQQQVGTKVDLEQRELAYQNSKTLYASARIKYDELKRQLDFNAAQAQKNLQISSKLESDYTLRSEIDGIVYSLGKEKGEIVTAQTPLAVIGDAKKFILEMQVDEYDILKVRKGQSAFITLDSYKGRVFEATITRINPLMNEKSKTFLVEATFVQAPEVLYPNVTFEASIVLDSKPKALLIPRSYLLNDSEVMKSNGEKVRVRTGLKDYLQVEILSGIGAEDELQKPSE